VQDQSKRLNNGGSWNLFLFESCVGSRGAAITTMCFLKATFEDSDNRG
jgi:hypothetical protein